MLLINYAGDLNCLNFELHTPLYYGNERILSILTLENGVKKVNKEDHEFDNNA